MTEIQPSIEAPTIAVATEQPAYAQPVAASTASAPTIEIQPQIEVAPAQDFNDNDIDELVGEVEELGDMAAEEAAAGPEVAVAEPEIDSPFEIDESNIPLAEDVEEPPALTVEPESETEVQAIELQPEADAGTGYDFSIEPAGDDFTNLPEVPAEAQAEGPPEAAAVEIEDPVEEPAEELDFEEEQAGAHAETAQAEVFLTEVAEDDELFDDPNLDVASIAPGESREVVIPVEIGAEGQAKRFKLCVRLKLDAIE